MFVRPTTRRFAVVAFCVIALSVLSLAGYRYRCTVLACEPQSWETMFSNVCFQLTMARPNYRIGTIRAEAPYRTPMTADGPQDVTIEIELVSTLPDPSYKDGHYAVETIRFDDREQWTTWEGGGGWWGGTPSLDWQERQGRVRIHPRDVFRTTWALVQRELPGRIVSGMSTTLYVEGEIPQNLGVESVWAISYFDDEHNHFFYFIDAQTGQIIFSGKPPYKTS